MLDQHRGNMSYAALARVQRLSVSSVKRIITCTQKVARGASLEGTAMPESVEHAFLKCSLDETLEAFAGTGLLGVSEADRGRYDYACRIERDFDRRLDAEVCWGNSAGLSKDLHHLLTASEAPIRLLLLKGTVDAERRLDELISDYKRRDPKRLAGFRVLALPSNFDADDDNQREWMAHNLKRRICSDLLFGVAFGRLSTRDVRAFVNHGGPFGLKCAILALCARSPIDSMRELLDRLGKTSKGPVREALIMLVSCGLLYQAPRAQPWFPTLKGRFLLDLMARLWFESDHTPSLSAETKLILDHVNVPLSATYTSEQIIDRIEQRGDYEHTPLFDLVATSIWAAGHYRVDIRQGINTENPVFRSSLDWSQFENLVPGNPLTAYDLMELD